MKTQNVLRIRTQNCKKYSNEQFLLDVIDIRI